MGDFAIPLGVKAPQIEDPLTMQGRQLSLMQMAQQGQINQAKIQEEQLKARLAQEDQRDYQTIQQAYAKTPGDMNSVRNEIAGKINPRNLMVFDSSTLKHAQELQKLGAGNLATQRDQSEQLARHLDAVSAVRQGDTSPDAVAARAAEWAKQVTLAKSEGYDQQNQLDPTKYPGDDQLPVLNVQLRGAQKFLDDEAKRREIADKAAAAQRATSDESRKAALAPAQQAEAESKAELARRQAASTILSVAAQQGADAYAAAYGIVDPKIAATFPKPEQFNPQTTPRLVRQLGQTPEQQVQSEQTEEQRRQAAIPKTEAELARDATNPNKPPAERQAASEALRRLDQSKLASRPITNVVMPGVPQASAQLHGEDYLKTIPGWRAAKVRAILTGEEEIPTGRTAGSGQNAQIVADVYQSDPEFKATLGKARKEVIADFLNSSAGKSGGQVTALKTLIHHADLYRDVADALQNGSFVPGNAIYNKVRAMFGSEVPTRADLVARFLAGETGKVSTGGVPGEGEVNGILSNLRNDGSPRALRGASDALLQIAAGRMEPIKEKYDRAHLERLETVPPVVGKNEIEILQRRGYDPETLKPVKSSGGGAPPLPLSLQQGDVGKVFTNREGKQIKVTKINPANPRQFQFDEVK